MAGLVGFILYFAALSYTGVIIMSGWNWHIAYYFGIREVNLVTAMSISLLFSLVNGDSESFKDSKEETLVRVGTGLVSATIVFASLFILTLFR